MAGGDATLPRPGARCANLRAGLLAAFACAALAAPVMAGGRVTEPYRIPPPDSVRFVHGLPSPSVALERSAYWTLVPLAMGGSAIVADVVVQGEGYLAAGGVILAAGGIIVGPAVGYAYGGMGGRAAVGVVLRFGLMVAVPAGAALAAADEGGDEEMYVAAGGFVLGSALALTSAIVDIATVRGDVERKNRQRAGAVRVSVGPALAPFSRAPGLAVSVPLGPGAP